MVRAPDTIVCALAVRGGKSDQRVGVVYHLLIAKRASFFAVFVPVGRKGGDGDVVNTGIEFSQFVCSIHTSRDNFGNLMVSSELINKGEELVIISEVARTGNDDFHAC